MTGRTLLLGAALALLAMACSVRLAEKKLPPNVCRLPSTREVLVSPDAAVNWLEPTVWAFEEWQSHVPGLRFNVIVSNHARDAVLDACETSIVPYDFISPEYEGITHAHTRTGVIRVARNPLLMTLESRKACMLHELGHLLFGFGHTTDMSSIMFPVIQALPALSASDIASARTAFALDRDGAIS